MKLKTLIGHLLLTVLLTGLIVILPAALTFGRFQAGASADVVTGATEEVPTRPSGEFVVLLNRDLHQESLAQWQSFFRDGELNVIFDDIQCIAAQGDAAAIQLAQRYQAQLPENQMTLRFENPMLLMSKAENGLIDTAIISKELASALALSIAEKDSHIMQIHVSGGTDDEKA